MCKMIEWKDFEKVDLRVGTIKKVEVFEKAKKPAYKMEIDFGNLGIKRSSAQITKLYKPEEIIGKQVIAVVNFPPKIIANFSSEVLVLGVVQGEGKDEDIILLEPERKAIDGSKIA